MRASINVLGPLLARQGEAHVALPGGDAIGSRPLDLHVDGAGPDGRRRSATSTASSSRRRRPAAWSAPACWLDFPSVGATENVLMAAVLAKGTTVIDNAAREPEIVDICAMLTQMGARIGGVGSSTLEVEGVDALRPVTPRRGLRPHRRRHLGVRRGDDPRRRHGARGAAPSTWRSRWTSWSPPARTVQRTVDGFRVTMRPPADRGRRGRRCRTRASRPTCSRWCSR